MSDFLTWLTDNKKNKMTMMVMFFLFIMNVASIFLLLSPEIKESGFDFLFYPFLVIQMISLMTQIPGTYLLMLYVFSRFFVEVFFLFKKKKSK